MACTSARSFQWPAHNAKTACTTKTHVLSARSHISIILLCLNAEATRLGGKYTLLKCHNDRNVQPQFVRMCLPPWPRPPRRKGAELQEQQQRKTANKAPEVFAVKLPSLCLYRRSSREVFFFSKESIKIQQTSWDGLLLFFIRGDGLGRGGELGRGAGGHGRGSGGHVNGRA